MPSSPVQLNQPFSYLDIDVVGPIVSDVEGLVNVGFAAAQNYASEAFTAAQTGISQLTNIANGLSGLPNVSDELGTAEQLIGAFVTPDLPIAPVTSITIPPVPIESGFAGVSSLPVFTPPEFTATVPVVTLPSAPGVLLATVPVAPTLPDITVPDSPTVVLPDVPALIGLTIPATPLLNLPMFTAVTPDSPLAPDYIFSFSESAYTSGLLTDLKARLQEWVGGASTGLAPQVEAAIWERGRVRDSAATAKKAQEVRRQFASWGFSKPPGALAIALLDAEQESQDAVIALSRDVMVKQAELEQSNRRFAFEQAFKVESDLITYSNQIAQRAFDAAKFTQQVFIDIYRETVARYQADIQLYASKVETFKVQINAELSKLEIYKAELEGQKLIGQLNEQQIAIYTARIQAAMAVVEIFKAQVQAANTLATVNKTQIESFTAQVNAYGETVRAKASEYDAYATSVKAEVSKVDIFKAQSDAYASQVGGFGAMINAVVAQKNIDLKIGQEIPIDLFKARTEVFRAGVEAQLGQARTLNEIYGVAAKVYDSQVQAEMGRMGAESTAYKSESDVLAASANIRIEAARANITALVQKLQLVIDAIKAGSQVQAQLAASALSGVNLSAGLSASGSASTGFSRSNTTSSSLATSVSNSNDLSKAETPGPTTSTVNYHSFSGA